MVIPSIVIFTQDGRCKIFNGTVRLQFWDVQPQGRLPREKYCVNRGNAFDSHVVPLTFRHFSENPSVGEFLCCRKRHARKDWLRTCMCFFPWVNPAATSMRHI